MISPEAAVVERLFASPAVAALLDNRIEPALSSEQTTLPRAVYTVISEDHQGHLQGGAGYVFQRLQIDVFAVTPESLFACCDAIRSRLDGFRGTITVGSDARFFGVIHLEGVRDDPVDPTDNSDQPTFRRLLDFLVSCREPAPVLTD